jgi:hypothetical protein
VRHVGKVERRIREEAAGRIADCLPSVLSAVGPAKAEDLAKEGGFPSSLKATEDGADLTAKIAARLAVLYYCNPSASRISAAILGPMDTRLINAKARRCKDAKRKAEIGKAESRNALPLRVFVTWRLCVEKPSLSVKSVKSVAQFLRLRLDARRSLRFRSVRPSAFPAVICGFLPKAATKQLSAFQLLLSKLRLIKAN